MESHLKLFMEKCEVKFNKRNSNIFNIGRNKKFRDKKEPT